MAQLNDAVPGLFLFKNGGTARKKGDLIAINTKTVGVCMVDIPANGTGSVDCRPGQKFRLKKETGTSDGWAAFALVYLDGTNPRPSGSSSGNTHAGIGVEAATDAATEGVIMINVANNLPAPPPPPP
jgi:hypothetical protein